MPILSINYGLSDITALYVSEDGDIKDFSISYPYSSDLFSHFYSEQEYYTDIFEHILKKLEIHKTDLKVIATGFPHVPAIGYDYSSTLTLDKLFKLVSDYNIVCADSSTIFTQDTFLSLQNLNNLQLGQNEKNYLANLYVYRNVFPTTLSNYNLLFSNIWHLVKSMNCSQNGKKGDKDKNVHGSHSKEKTHTQDKPMLFFGDIFTVHSEEFMEIAYLYMISLLKIPGIYSMAFDPKNMYPHYVHIKAFDLSLSEFIKDYHTETIGCLLNSPGETTCLVETESGTSQLVELTEGKIFFVPMRVETSSRVVIKNEILGSIERKVSGGKLGFIIDTRRKNDSEKYKYADLQQDINVNLKYIGEALSRL